MITFDTSDKSKLISSLSMYVCIVIGFGCLFPFVKIDPVWPERISVIKCIFDEYSEVEIWSIILLFLSLIVSFIAAKIFEQSEKISTTVVMLLSCVIGMNAVEEILDAYRFDMIKFLFGAFLLRWGYRILLLFSIAALGLNIRLKFFTDNSPYKNMISQIVPLNTVIKCPVCGTEHNTGCKFCRACGHPLSDSSVQNSVSKHWICPNCKNENSNSALHCSNCGFKR